MSRKKCRKRRQHGATDGKCKQKNGNSKKGSKGNARDGKQPVIEMQMSSVGLSVHWMWQRKESVNLKFCQVKLPKMKYKEKKKK